MVVSQFSEHLIRWLILSYRKPPFYFTVYYYNLNQPITTQSSTYYWLIDNILYQLLIRKGVGNRGKYNRRLPCRNNLKQLSVLPEQDVAFLRGRKFLVKKIRRISQNKALLKKEKSTNTQGKNFYYRSLIFLFQNTVLKQNMLWIFKISILCM